ncbi:MAG: nucleotidyltransferase substrate binding protein [Pseudanabaenaceae cyanobacterium bins.39]|nr:nucleotidyltransferase substrate binding protein [Pseudanabaenaceae cyanobacterium bins.39]
MEEDIRWIQRFSNFERSFLLLQESIKIEKLSVLERAGLIQFFEMTFELAWKLLKDYEETEGLKAQTPREAIKQAFQSGLISNGHDWIDALQDRNLTSHTYNEETAIAVETKIRGKYFQLLAAVYAYFKNKIANL